MRTWITLMLLFCSYGAVAQTEALKSAKKLERKEEKRIAREKKIKTGWNFGPLPAVGYNSDLGFQYGALCEIYYFGDGSIFPQYLHKFYVEASLYTKGSGVFHVLYDSKYLIKGIRTTVTASYLPDRMMDFYGFNGYMTPYDRDEGKSFYKMNRDLTRAMVDFQGNITSDKFRWAAGLAFYNYKIGEVKLKKYEGAPSLYDLYIQEGIIKDNQKNGGSHLEIKAGLVYDTRDNEPDPTRGTWTEAILYGSPDLFTKQHSNYLKLSFVHRGYIPLVDKRLTFAYRLAYQGLIAGSEPFYVQQNLATLLMRQVNSEGLGGNISLRGVLRNRVVGNGYAWANAEVRYRFLDFRLFKQNWYLATNPFFDAGMVVQPYQKSLIEASTNPLIYDGGKEGVHMAAGIGVKAVMNRNFVVSVEWGKALDKRDGNSNFTIGLNYLY